MVQAAASEPEHPQFPLRPALLVDAQCFCKPGPMGSETGYTKRKSLKTESYFGKGTCTDLIRLT